MLHSAATATMCNRFPTNTLEREFCCILFDMDGTLIDSTQAIIKFWHEIGRRYSLNAEEILATSHGRRSIDIFRRIDPKCASWDYLCKLEGDIPLRWGDGAVEIPGARKLLDKLKESTSKWAVVTSGTRPLVDGWLKILGLAAPQILVTAEDVESGKPEPACYKLGLKSLFQQDDPLLPPLCIEDAPAGIRAGRAAGCKVLAVSTTHTLEQLIDAGAHWVVQDLRSVSLKSVYSDSYSIKVEFRNVLFARHFNM